MSQFHVGQKVVCIDDKFKNVSIDQGIRKGQVYTLRWVGPFSHYIDGEFIGVKLVEIDRGLDDGPEGYGYDDMPFRATRFRPLVKDKIGALRSLLAPKQPANDDPGGNAPVKKNVKDKEKV